MNETEDLLSRYLRDEFDDCRLPDASLLDGVRVRQRARRTRRLAVASSAAATAVSCLALIVVVAVARHPHDAPASPGSSVGRTTSGRGDTIDVPTATPSTPTSAAMTPTTIPSVTPTSSGLGG